MAETGKINSVFDVPAITKEKEVVSGLIASLWKEMEKGLGGLDKSQSMFGDAKKISDVAKAIDTLNKAKADSAKQMTEVAKLQQKLTDLDTKEAKQIAELKLAIQDKNKATKDQIKVENEVQSAYKNLGKELQSLKNVYRDIAASGKANTKEAKALKEQIGKLDTQIKDIDADMGQYQKNVGNYESAWGNLKGVMMVATGVIAGVWAAIKSGKAIIESAQVLSDKWAIATTAADFALKSLMKSIATGDWSNLISNMESAIRLGSDYTKVLDDLGDRNRALAISEAKICREIERLQGEMMNQMKNDKERKAIAEEIIGLELKIMQEREDLAQRTFDNEVKRVAGMAGLQKKELLGFVEKYNITEELRGQAKEYNQSLKDLNNTSGTSVMMIDNMVVSSNEGGIAMERQKKVVAGASYEVKTYAMLLEKMGATTDEELEAVKDSWVGLINEQTAYFAGTKKIAGKVSGFEKQIEDANKAAYAKRIAGLEKVKAAAGKLEKEIYDIKVKYGLLDVKEIAEEGLRIVVESEAFKALTVEQQETIMLAIRSKAATDYFDKMEEMRKKELAAAKAQGQAMRDINKTMQDQIDADMQASVDEMQKVKDDAAAADKIRLDKRVTDEEEAKEKIEELTRNLATLITELVNAQFERQLDILDQEAHADEEAKDRELEAAGNNVNKRNEVEAKFAEKEKERAAESLKIRQRQAKFNKTVGIVDATINTLIGVTGALKSSMDIGPILAVIMAALILASGIATVATIASTPIPTYKTGRSGGKAEMAVVGEVGQEAITTRSGESYLTPNKASLAYLPEGSSVIPHKDLVSMYGRSSMTDVPRWSGSDGVAMMELSGKIDITNMQLLSLQNVVKNKKEAHISIDKRGISTAFKNGAVYEEWMNNKILM